MMFLALCFFGSISSFRELLDVANDPQTAIIDFAGSRIFDQFALQAIEDISEKYSQAGTRVLLRRLSPDCRRLLARTGQLEVAKVMVRADNDPDY